MARVFIFGGGAIFLLFLTFGAYFLTREDKSKELNFLIVRKEKLAQDLVLAEEQLNKEKEVLDNMISRSQSFSFSVASMGIFQIQVEEQIKIISKIVRETDSKRSEVNLILSRLQENGIFLTKEIEKKETDKKNTELSISEIVKIKEEIKIAQSLIKDVIVLEKTIVAQAQTEVLILQEQFQNIQEQIQQLSLNPLSTPTPNSNSSSNPTSTLDSISPATPTTPTSETGITINPNSENLNSQEEDEYNSQGIIIQPGEPRLIQGTDAF